MPEVKVWVQNVVLSCILLLGPSEMNLLHGKHEAPYEPNLMHIYSDVSPIEISGAYSQDRIVDRIGL